MRERDRMSVHNHVSEICKLHIIDKQATELEATSCSKQSNLVVCKCVDLYVWISAKFLHEHKVKFNLENNTHFLNLQKKKKLTADLVDLQ